jgi:peroxiredoxin
MTPAIGTQAPDFTIPSTSGTASLSALRGNGFVLLAFFPLAFTSTCTAEMCAFTEDYSQFEGRGVTVLGISVDSVPTLKEYRAKHAISVELASDFRREVSRAFGVLNEDKYYSNRSYFLVDKSGVVRWSHVESVNGQRRENAELVAAIESVVRT